MALDRSLNGDITKIEGGAFLGAALSEKGEFIGLYALTQDATYIRGAGSWITAKGPALSRLNGAQLVEMTKIFINTFDKLDSKGETPTTEQIARLSTKGNPASWDTQQKNIERASGVPA